MFQSIYLTNRLFIAFGACVCLFILSYSFAPLFFIAQAALLLWFLLVIIDAGYLFFLIHHVKASRKVHDQLSLSDVQTVQYSIENHTGHTIDVQLVDELPHQLQHRQGLTTLRIRPSDREYYDYIVRPVERGKYVFGNLHILISNPYLNLVQLRSTFKAEKEVAVVPSIIQLKKYQLQVFSKTASLAGIRQVRQVGENDEFEHIKMYSQGDHIKSINWKATSRKNQLMVNQYQNSRSQMIYTIIDMGRSMKMPFNELTLLDYAINSSLVLSNIILKKYDKAGLITFSNQMGDIVKADASPHQLNKISNRLYHQKTGFKESNFELLFYTLRKHLTRRSIILLYTNFETTDDLDRNLPYLKGLSRKHLLVVISFINTELIETAEMECNVKSDIYTKTFAQRTLIEKEIMQNTLASHGIQSILTKPEDLSIQVINKYLEIKAKRMR